MPNIQLFGSIPMRSLPLIEENLDPARHGYGPDVAGFALPVDDGLEQIQFLLGHVSIQTTERYLGCKQRIRSAVNDEIGITPRDS